MKRRNEAMARRMGVSTPERSVRYDEATGVQTFGAVTPIRTSGRQQWRERLEAKAQMSRRMGAPAKCYTVVDPNGTTSFGVELTDDEATLARIDGKKLRRRGGLTASEIAGAR